MREGDWKLFTSHAGDKAELYNIPQDPGEAHDVAKEYPEIVQALTQKALRLGSRHCHPALLAIKSSRPGCHRKRRGVPQGKAKAKASTAKPGTDRKTIFKQKDTDKDGVLSAGGILEQIP